ncbi:MAG TPA: hypothetical protein VMS38_03015 [Pseudorhodoferax sp.]|nr:hypothetical protein [Pseudorhodoferax sp.]
MKLGNWLVVAALTSVATGGGVLAANYEKWFVNPERIQVKRGYATHQLRDPSSVQFRDERLAKDGWLCGELNGKNSYGAYVGFKRFMARAADDAWVEGVGYAGKPGARSTDQIAGHLDAKNQAMKAINAAREATPSLPPLSSDELEKISEQDLFDQRWQMNCL